MLTRLCAILVTTLIVLQYTVGGHGALSGLCLGGDLDHAMESSCAAVCAGHDAPSSPSESHDHHDECGCVDINLAFATIRAFDEVDSHRLFAAEYEPVDQWRLVALVSSSCANGPPGHASYSPARAQQLAVVSTIRLNI